MKNIENKIEQVVIPDECGDTMWDAVLQHEVKICKINENRNNAETLLNGIADAQVCDANEAK